jgi:hypothetical protein
MPGAIPDWLLKARADVLAPIAPEAESECVVGDLCLLRAMDGRSRNLHGVVIGDDAEDGVFELSRPRAVTVMLASAATEELTDLDLFLPRDMTGLAYDLMARTDIVGPVLTVQVGRRLASVNGNDLDALLAAASGHRTLLPAGRIGVTPRSPRDARLLGKRQELVRFLGMTRPAQTELAQEPCVIIAPKSGTSAIAQLTDSADGNAIASDSLVAEAADEASDLGLGADLALTAAAAQLKALSALPTKAATRGKAKWDPRAPRTARNRERLEAELLAIDRPSIVLRGLDGADEGTYSLEDQIGNAKQVMVEHG